MNMEDIIDIGLYLRYFQRVQKKGGGGPKPKHLCLDLEIQGM